MASLSQGRTAAAQCGLFKHKSVPVIFEPPCISGYDPKKCNGFRSFSSFLHKKKLLLGITDKYHCTDFLLVAQLFTL